MFAPLVQSLALILVETFKTKNNPNPKVSTLRSYMYVTLVVVVVVVFFKKKANTVLIFASIELQK